MDDNFETVKKIFISFLHLLLMYTISLIALISTNEMVVFYALIIMIIIKFNYYLFDRCVLTYLEDGKIYASAAQLFGYTVINKKLNDGDYEEILINIALILLINKLLIMLIIQYYFKYLPNNFKKIISKYLYNGYKL